MGWMVEKESAWVEGQVLVVICETTETEGRDDASLAVNQFRLDMETT